MEIAFIWVSKFRSLENIGLNFSAENFFSFDPDTKVLKKEDSREITIKNFFNENVTNLSAIVGENGVGKTSIFYLLRIVYSDIIEQYKLATEKNYKAKEQSNNQDLAYVAVLKKGNEMFFFKSLKLANIKTNIPDARKKLSPIIEKSYMLYYANIFDYSSFNYGSYVYDLSTNSIVDYVINQITQQYEEETYPEKEFAFLYKTQEISDQLNFLVDFEKEIPFEMPAALTIEINFSQEKGDVLEYHQLDDEEEEDGKEEVSQQDIDYYTAVNTIIELLDNFSIQDKDKTHKKVFSNFRLSLQKAALENFIKKYAFENTQVLDYYELHEKVAKLIPGLATLQEETHDKIFIEIFKRIGKATGAKYDGSTLLKWIDDFVNFLEQEKLVPNDLSATVLLSNSNGASFKKLLERYFANSFYPTIIDFHWEGISSGENAFLTMFSRFYSLTNIRLQESTLIVLLDECEVNFHPNWQKKLVYYLNNILPKIFPNSTIQIILSSHSPIILSDIPRSNVLFLKKEDGVIISSQLEEKKQTFGANIHTLLSDAFFMQEGMVGDFAKEKINSLIDKLTSRYKIIENEIEEIKDIIDIIGEPVIKSKLIQMLNDKLALNLNNLQERVKKLEDNIKR
jgi:predicted ATPase